MEGLSLNDTAAAGNEGEASGGSTATQTPDKHPLSALGHKAPAALLKVYDADASYRPASVLDLIGIVSQGVLPSFDEGDVSLVPAVHVLKASVLDAPHVATATDAAARQSLVEHLSRAFDPPDAAAGELLLLALLARPEQRQGVPLGQLSLNIIRPNAGSTLSAHLTPLLPALVNLPLSLNLLHGAAFRPKSDGALLTPGLLQLAPGTLLLVDEDALGEGELAERAVRNLQALSELLAEQNLTYEYPYSSGVRIATSVRALVESEGRSLLPVDAALPATLSASVPTPSEEDLGRWRAYIAHHSSSAHAGTFAMPDAVATLIQDDFVRERQAGGAGSIEKAEARLKLRMKLARLLTLSEGSEVTEGIWRRAVELENELERRNAEREARRRETTQGRTLGQPTEASAVPNGTTEGQPNGETAAQ